MSSKKQPCYVVVDVWDIDSEGGGIGFYHFILPSDRANYKKELKYLKSQEIKYEERRLALDRVELTLWGFKEL